MLPIYCHNLKQQEILGEAIDALPKNAQIYLVGGAVRNAVYYDLFKKQMPQRDYDILLIGERKEFVQHLRARGFVYGKILRKNDIVLMKKKIALPKTDADYVVLDIHSVAEGTARSNLTENANFTINGFALPFAKICSEDWKKHLIQIPCAFADLKNKQLRVNKLVHPSNLFACIRFMSQGFKAPTTEEIQMLLKVHSTFEKWRFPRNVRKVFDYVGGEGKARQLARKLGIKVDIFDYTVVRRLR